MRRAWLSIVPDGAVVEISGPTRIGRGKQCEVRTDSDRVSRVHSLVTPKDGAYWLRDQGSSYGTWLTRAGVQHGRLGGEASLEHGDIFGLMVPVKFTLEPVPDDLLERDLAAAVAAAPHDAARWQVYADRLLERGDSRGLRIVQAAAGSGPAI